MTNRQQVFVLIVEHSGTHTAMASQIQAAVMDITEVSRVGVLIKDMQSGTVIREQACADPAFESTYPVLR